jgi:hypothetical protein
VIECPKEHLLLVNIRNEPMFCVGDVGEEVLISGRENVLPVVMVLLLN